ncbi:MAG: glycosyltransferase family 4 protein [Candidatus Schekmanbacteria bacterium]|nr:glycosyltransferase family 4 protein [Candidatus Schekmanbacteria bacterium]
MPTILHTESSLGWGGQEGRILREALGLRDKGWRVIMACQPGSGLEREATKTGFTCFPVKMSTAFSLSAVNCLLKLFQQEQVNIAVTHSSIDSWLTGWSSLLAAHKPIIVRVRHLQGGINNRFVYTGLCNTIVAVSQDIKQHMILNKGIPADKIQVIYSGIDTKRFQLAAKPLSLRAEWGVKPDEKLIGIVAVLRNKKGHRFLIRAAAAILNRHPKTKFVFVGSGPKEQEIKEEIAQKKLDRYFILAGKRDDIPEVLNSLDVFVLPSQMEALGQAIIEAMAAGLPVVASRVGGIPELVREGETGFLVPPEDSNALAGAIIKLLNQPQTARQMGLAGQKTVQENFDYHQMIGNTERLYRSLLTNIFGS